MMLSAMDHLSSLSPAHFGFAGASLLAFVLAYLYHARRPRAKAASSSSTPSGVATPTQTRVEPKGSGWLAVAPDGRDWGHWIPSDFRMPEITPDVDFDMQTTLPVSSTLQSSYSADR